MLSKLWGLSMGEVALTLSVLAQAGAVSLAHLPDGRMWCLPQAQQLALLHVACREAARGYHQALLDAYTGAAGPQLLQQQQQQQQGGGRGAAAQAGGPRRSSLQLARSAGPGPGGEAAATPAFRRPLRLQEVRDDGYFLINVGHHLMGAGRHLQMRALLLDPGWLAAKLAAAGPTGVVADFRRYLMANQDPQAGAGELRCAALGGTGVGLLGRGADGVASITSSWAPHARPPSPAPRRPSWCLRPSR